MPPFSFTTFATDCSKRRWILGYCILLIARPVYGHISSNSMMHCGVSCWQPLRHFTAEHPLQRFAPTVPRIFVSFFLSMKCDTLGPVHHPPAVRHAAVTSRYQCACTFPIVDIRCHCKRIVILTFPRSNSRRTLNLDSNNSTPVVLTLVTSGTALLGRTNKPDPIIVAEPTNITAC